MRQWLQKMFAYLSPYYFFEYFRFMSTSFFHEDIFLRRCLIDLVYSYN